MDMFPDEKAARKWMKSIRWPVGICCPNCGSMNYRETPFHRSMDYRCRDRHQYFSVRKGTFHKISRKHLHRYVNEFAGRHNIRKLDTIHPMATISAGDGSEEATVRGPDWREDAWTMRTSYDSEVYDQ